MDNGANWCEWLTWKTPFKNILFIAFVVHPHPTNFHIIGYMVAEMQKKNTSLAEDKIKLPGVRRVNTNTVLVPYTK